jgi:hypothetical protein
MSLLDKQSGGLKSDETKTTGDKYFVFFHQNSPIRVVCVTDPFMYIRRALQI